MMQEVYKVSRPSAFLPLPNAVSENKEPKNTVIIKDLAQNLRDIWQPDEKLLVC
jgi:hypothetical protein